MHIYHYILKSEGGGKVGIVTSSVAVGTVDQESGEDGPFNDPRVYKTSKQNVIYMYTQELSTRVEAGSNTSTVDLRVIRGDEKGTPCLGV
jgi:hypothetical protein